MKHPNIKRKLATEQQLKTLINLSEQKNTPKEHFAIMAAYGQITASDASFDISTLSNPNVKYNDRTTRNINCKITEDPNYYNEFLQSNEMYSGESFIDHVVVELKRSLAKKDFKSAAIAKIELIDRNLINKYNAVLNEFPKEFNDLIDKEINAVEKHDVFKGDLRLVL